MAVGMMGELGMGAAVVLTLVGIVLGAVFLWLSARIFKLHDKSFMTPLTIAAIVGVVGYILGLIPFVNMVGGLVTIVLGVWLIKDKYRLHWGKAVLVWLVYFALAIVAMLVIMMLFFGTWADFGMMG